MISYVDGRLQAHFDAVFHFAMRRGVSKTALRWWIWSAFTVIYLGSLRTLFKDWPGAILGLFLGLLHLWVWGWVIQKDRDADEEAERRGMASWADTDFKAKSAKLTGWLYMGLGMPSFVAYCITGILSPSWDCDLYRFVAGCFGLAGGYLCGTKPAPPLKKKERAPLGSRMVLE